RVFLVTGVQTCALPIFGPTAALAADALGDRPDQLARLQGARQVVRDGSDEAHLVRLDRAEHDDARAETRLQLIGSLAERLRIHAVEPRGEHLDAGDVLRFLQQIAAAASGEPAAQRLHLALERARALDQLRDLVRDLVAPRLHEARDVAQHVLRAVHPRERAGAGDGLDPA